MSTDSYISPQYSPEDLAAALDPADASRLAELFAALSDATRLRILSVLLHAECNVQQISERVQMSHSAVSHQLRGLRLLRIVRVRKQGREAFYALDDAHITELFRRGLDHIRHE